MPLYERRTAPLRILQYLMVALLPCWAPMVSAQLAKPAEAATRSANQAVLNALPFADRNDYADARRGFIASLPDATIAGPSGAPAWTMQGYEFLGRDAAPDTVNPSLWRQAQLNAIHGLFKVTERIYQVRGFDLSNMTIVESDNGVIVIDPLISAETAHAALELYRSQRGARAVVAVIYSHSHIDHFGGVKGVIDEADVRAGKVSVIAPEGFMDHAIAENVIAGNAMSRRALYMYGPLLPRGERGQVDTGLGKTLSHGTVTLIAPTDSIGKSGETRSIDGVQVEFHLTPGTEAPSEMNLYFPQFRTLDIAENATHNLHNLYTLRGAEVRDGNAWAHYLDEALQRYGARSDVLIAQHQWPVWDQAHISDYLAKQRDLYKFINDQSVRLMNQGYTPGEIAEKLKLPPGLDQEWFARGYYGTLSHNAKAVYQKYLGWYDANPAHLNPLPPVEAAQKTIEYMGGADAVIKRARVDFAAGNYRWVADVMNQVVFADPSNRTARELGADALEQLGYQSEAATWRNAYLMGAAELRSGVISQSAGTSVGADLIRALPLENFFDFLGVRLNAERAAGQKIVVNWNFTDVRQQFVLNLDHSALTWRSGEQSPKADVTVTLDRATLDAISLKQTSFLKAALSGKLKLEGDTGKLRDLMGYFDDFSPNFEIVEPRRKP